MMVAFDNYFTHLSLNNKCKYKIAVKDGTFQIYFDKVSSKKLHSKPDLTLLTSINGPKDTVLY